MSPRRYWLICSLVPWLWSPTAGAEFKADPETACNLLSDIGLRGRNYRHIGEGLYQCRSRRRNLALGGNRTHAMRFQAQGDQDTVRQLRLTLFVNSREQLQATFRRMLRDGQLLMNRALQVEMPEEVVRRLLDGATGTWQAAGADVVLERSQVRAVTFEYHLVIR